MSIKLSYGLQEILVECQQAQKTNVAHALKSLRDRHPDIYQRVCAKDGTIRPPIQVFVNGVHVRYLNQLETELGEGDQVYVIPILAGG